MAKAFKKQALGRGLSALLKDPENDNISLNDSLSDKVTANIMELDINTIEVNPFQPRTNFNEESLQELASSIKELGLIQPITVRKVDFNKYQLIAGERRLRASNLIGLEKIPAYIRLANDNDSLTMALVENIQRHDLDPIEIALSYQRLMTEIDLTQEQVSLKVGKKRSTIANYLRLLRLDPIIQTGIRDNFISMGHGRALINLEDTEVQTLIYHKIIKENLSVRQTEQLVKSYQESLSTDGLEKPIETTKAFTLPSHYCKSFDNFFQAKVDIKVSKDGKGKISIPFASQEDLDRIIKLLETSEK